MGITSSFRLFSIFSFGLLGLVFYFLLYNYFSGLADSKRSNLIKLKAIACTAALGIDGDLHRDIEIGYTELDGIQSVTDDSAYYQIHQQLRRVQEINGLETPIYTMVYDSISSEFQFIVSSSQTPYFRHQYKMYPQQLLEDFSTGGILDVYESENGVWLSAFAPVFDRMDRVVGLVQVDENFSSFYAIQRKELLINSIISVSLIAPFTIFFFHYLKKRIRQEEKLKEKISHQNKEIIHVNKELTLNNLELDKSKKIIQLKNRELDSRVKQRTKDLLKVNLELRNLLYRTSHDIMGPLATLEGLCHLGKIEFVDKEFLKFFNKIESTAGDLTHRINGLSKIYDVKNREPIHKKVVPAHLIRQIFDSITTNAPDLKIKFINEVPESLCFVTDPDLFYLTFYELLCIVLKNNLDNDFIKINHKMEGKGLHCFQVEDNGIWQNAEIKGEFKKLFESNGSPLNDSGLRLYLAMSAIKKLEGNITLESGQKNDLMIKVIIQGD